MRRAGRRQSGQPTISDVARLAHCSLMTVSRVINGEGSVREQTRAAVLAAITELNYSPNNAARSLARADQIRIALLYANPSPSYLSEFLMGCLDQAGRSDVHLVIERCDHGVDEEAVVRRLAANGVDGFLLVSPLCDERPLLDLLRRLRVRAALVGPGRAEAHHSAVMIDDYQAAFDMTSHILGLGHRRIGFIVGDPLQEATGQRLAGYQDAMASNGLEPRPELIVGGLFTYRSGFEAASTLLDQEERPTAIFASNDDMAAAAVAAAHRRRLDVPADLTICGFDDTAIASAIWPELTTVRQPIRAMSQKALEFLANDLRAAGAGKAHAASHLTLAYELVRRGSDGPPRGGP